MSARRTIVAVLLIGLATGCFSAGRDFPVDPVDRIRMGETTRAEIEAWFGRPWRTGIDDGRPTWTYGYYRYALLGEARTRDLVVRFDDSGRVASYTFNEAPPRMEGRGR